jgi:hypothetical protein
MRLIPLAVTLLLGSSIGFSTTCGHVLAADASPPTADQSAAAPTPEMLLELAAQRHRMVRMIQLEAELTRERTGVGEIDPRVLLALGEVPRRGRMGTVNLSAEDREGWVKCGRSYAAAAAPVISAQSSKALVRVAR